MKIVKGCLLKKSGYVDLTPSPNFDLILQMLKATLATQTQAS